MSGTIPKCPIPNDSDKSDNHFCNGNETEDVAKEDRKRRVLAFLVDTKLALPRSVLFRNLRHQGADFSDSSLKNYLGELREEGFIERIDADLYAEGQIKVSDDDPGYWIRTAEGMEYMESYREGRVDDIDIGR